MRKILPVAALSLISCACSKAPAELNQTGSGEATRPKQVASIRPTARPTSKPSLTKHFTVKTLPYDGLSQPATLKQAIVSAIELSNGQGLFYESVAIAGSKISDRNFLVRFHRGTFSGDESKGMKEKLFEVVFTPSNITVKSFVKRTPAAQDVNLCKAVAAACSYSFGRKYLKADIFQVDAEKEKPDGFDMQIYRGYPPEGGTWFKIGLTHDFRLSYYDEGS